MSVTIGSSFQKALLTLSMLLMLLTGMLSSAPSADAAAYTKSVYAPNKIASTLQLEAWADLSLDCSGTLGCWNYIKIEDGRYLYSLLPTFIAGKWATANGWNKITANLPYGCGKYRTTVDSYNDIAGGYGSGVNTGQVGTSSNGTKVYRYRTTWSSGWIWICR